VIMVVLVVGSAVVLILAHNIPTYR
jgi:hypothetical protein